MAFSWAETACGRIYRVKRLGYASLVATYSNDEPVRVADQEQRNIVHEDGVEDQV